MPYEDFADNSRLALKMRSIALWVERHIRLSSAR